MTAHNMRTDRFDSSPRLAPPHPRVLLATDGSDAARAGEEWVRRLRWVRPPAIDVLTVAPPPSRASGLGLQTYRTAVREALVQAGETELLDAQRVANAVGLRLQETGVRVRVWARRGDAADEIVRMARLEVVDLVVVGSQGRWSRGLVWRRSVSSQVAAESEPAVLVAQRVPPGDDELPRSIAVLVVDDSAAADALSWLTDMGWLSNSHLTMVRLEGPDRLGSRPTAPLWQGTGQAATTAASEEVLVPDRERSIDAVRTLAEQRAIDLAVLPRRRDRREIELAMRIADAARVAVLAV